MLCDTPVPCFDNPVKCGLPASIGDVTRGKVRFPMDLLKIDSEIVITAKGDSMKDAGIVTGDKVKVVGDVTVYDGDIVLARIDDEYTLKVYYEDDDEQKWLVPQNEKYSPILLDGCMDVSIVGRVDAIIKNAPRLSARQCKKAVSRAKEQMAMPRVITMEDAEEAIRMIAPIVKKARHWFSVYRVLADNSVVNQEDFDGFCLLVARVVPAHQHLPVADEMQRMNDGCFKKCLTLWTEDKAPVKNKHYKYYHDLGVEMTRLLEP